MGVALSCREVSWEVSPTEPVRVSLTSFTSRGVGLTTRRSAQLGQRTETLEPLRIAFLGTTACSFLRHELQAKRSLIVSVVGSMVACPEFQKK